MKNNVKFCFLSDVINHYNEKRKHAAMSEYLDSERHTTFLIAGTLIEQCNNSTKALARGVISPRLDICCCNETFENILLYSTKIQYLGFDIPEEDCADPNEEPGYQLIPVGSYKQLMRMNDDKLAEALETEYNCPKVTFVHTHNEDEKLQRQYYQAVIKHFMLMANFANSIDSESTKVWLDATRLLQPCGSDFVAADVKKAYERAEEAQGMLWVDMQFKALAKNAAKKTSKKR